MGLDRPLVVQYLGYLFSALKGNLGVSAYSHQSVIGEIAQVLPSTIQLVLVGMAITVLMSLPLGIIAALKEGRAADTAIRIVLVIEGGVPVFWLAIMLRWILGANLRWFPITGENSIGGAPPDVTGFTILDSILFGTPANLGDSISHLFLPALALSGPFIATLARNVRSSMATAMRSDYITFAIAKGVPPGRVVIRHGLRSALGSTLTIIGMQFGWMVSAAVLVETVFGLQGIGTLMYKSIVSHDTFAVLGSVLVVGFVFVFTSLVIDLLQMVLDPRVRYARMGAT
jgi:peptide/nickel transport system permease protein